MAEPFIGEIRMFAGNFAPQGWAFCDGQLLAISQNDALFSLFGTQYGGDGRTTFGLPELRGRVPIHIGSGPGQSPRNIGHKAGDEQVTVVANEIANHSHAFSSSTAAAGDTSPISNTAATPSGAYIYSDGTTVDMNSAAITSTGGGQAHSNLMPTLCIHFIVALFGTYPSRT